MINVHDMDASKLKILFKGKNFIRTLVGWFTHVSSQPFDGYWVIYVPQLLIVMPLSCNNHFSEIHYFPIVTNS